MFIQARCADGLAGTSETLAAAAGAVENARPLGSGATPPSPGAYAIATGDGALAFGHGHIGLTTAGEVNRLQNSIIAGLIALVLSVALALLMGTRPASRSRLDQPTRHFHNRRNESVNRNRRCLKVVDRFRNCDGKISTSHTVGETTVHNFDGKLGTSQTVGNTTVHNLGNKLGTSHTVGTTTMHNFDGKFGWSQRFGNIVVHSGALFTDR